MTVTLPYVVQERLKSAAHKGAEYLDSTDPGWEKIINLESLNMSDCAFCVLGQICVALGHNLDRRGMLGSWTPYQIELRLRGLHDPNKPSTDKKEIALGFDDMDTGYGPWYSHGDAMPFLTKCWKEEIQKRLNPPAPQGWYHI